VPSCNKRRNGFRLRGPDFQGENSARLQHAPSFGNQTLVNRHPARAAKQSKRRFPVADLALQRFAIRERHVRRIRYNNIRRAIGEAFAKIGFEELHLCAQSKRI
jgi:hypothetical protein